MALGSSWRVNDRVATVQAFPFIALSSSMSAGLDAARGTGGKGGFEWPNVLLLHLHLRTGAAPLSHNRQYLPFSCTSLKRSATVSVNSAAKIRETAQAPYSRAAEDSQHALNAFTAAFKDAFRRRQAARCLSLVFDYAKSLPKATDEAITPSSYAASPVQAPLQPAPQCAISEPFRQQVNDAAGRGSTMKGQSRLSLSLRSKRHLSQVLKGRHQELMKMLITDGNARGAIDYLYLLPPDRQLCSSLMKECSAVGSYADLQMAIKVWHLHLTWPQL